jgi:16S rRNA (guanine1207-N2)-methyltransferase
MDCRAKNRWHKTYIEKCRPVFGNGSIEKSGAAYLGHFRKSNDVLHTALLDDQDYASLRLVQTTALDFYSKPGVFGWNRIDQGSAFLLDALPDCLKSFPLPPQSLLDLGCGYGYLTLMTRDLPFSRRVATDNNAAALLAMRCNADHYGINVDIMPADAGDALDGLFDLVLCNPPFHQGFSVAGDLTDKFLRGTRRLLSPQGKALFVVNQFVGLERKAGAYFSAVDVLANNRSFKVVRVQV